MDDTTNVGGRDRLVRLLLTVGLSILSVRWLKRGKRLRGLLAGVGALGFGFNATTGYCGVNDALDIDTTTDAVGIDFEESDTADPATSTGTAVGDDSGEPATDDSHSLHCAACGEAIRPGQSRGPDEDGDTVHDDCA